MISKKRFSIVCLLLAATFVYMDLHSEGQAPINRPFQEFPGTLGGWRTVAQMELDEQVLDTLKPTDYLSRTYEGRGGRTIQLYIGYHGGGKNGGEIHSPKHCLPGTGWYKASSEKIKLSVGGEEINLVKALYQKGEVRELFYYWFQVGGRTLSDEFSLKLAQVANSILRGRRDSTFVRITVPVDTDLEQSSASGRQFIEDWYPLIKSFLPS